MWLSSALAYEDVVRHAAIGGRPPVGGPLARAWYLCGILMLDEAWFSMSGARAGSYIRSTTLNQFQHTTTLRTGRQTVGTYSDPHMTFFQYCQVLYLLVRHGLRAEAVKDLTLRDNGICRGVHHYQIIARRQDFEAPLPHGVALCGLPTSSHRMSAFRPNSMGILIRQEQFCCFPRPP